MIENRSHLERYKLISEEVKHLTNSLSRLKILATLYEQPKSMKDLTSDTGLSYSSVSSTMHKLELEGYVYRESSRYYLSNCMKLKIENILELNEIIGTLNKFFNILDKHLIEMIPKESVVELHLIDQASLIESNDIDAYKTYNYIGTALNEAEEVRCILPFNYGHFNEQLEMLAKNKKDVELMVSENIFYIFEEGSNIKKVSSFRKNNNFLLIITDKTMMLGLFKEDGYFDQNRLLISKNDDSIKWANNLFNNFKKENK